MASTYEKIATTTLGSATSTVTFSSISGSYTDLVLIGNGSASAGVTLGVRFNSDTGNNYSNTNMYGSGTAAISGRDTNVNQAYYTNWYTTYDGTINMNIQNYSNTTTYKTAIVKGGNAGNYTWASALLWRSTSAITSVTLLADGTTFSSGSTFTLYGILKA